MSGTRKTRQLLSNRTKASAKIFLIALVLGIVLGIATYRGLERHFRDEPEDTKVIETQEPQISSKLEYCKLSEIGVLDTAEFYFTIVQEYDSTNADSKWYKKLSDELKKKRFLYSYDGSIKAGIDCSGVETAYDDANKKVTVKLPDVKMFEPTIDFTSLHVYLEESGWFSTITLEDMNTSQEELVKAAKKNAEDIGLLKTAETNAKNIIKNMIHSTPGFENYEVSFN